MRINKYVSQATGLSRRVVDELIQLGRIQVNKKTAVIGQDISSSDKVYLDNDLLEATKKVLVLFNKPAGYVCSRDGQGSETIYDLLPEQYKRLKTIGRLDKDSSGLILLTNDGDLAHKLAHPKFAKEKIYEVELDKKLSSKDRELIEAGKVHLDNKPSKLTLKHLRETNWQVSLSEGRNRQIRRTFSNRGYQVINLKRTTFGDYELSQLGSQRFLEIPLQKDTEKKREI